MSLSASAARILAAQLAVELERIVIEATEIERLAAIVTPPVVDPTLLWALGGHLQAFYSGTEAILLRVLREVDGMVPAGPDSHREVLRQACIALPGLRPAILEAAQVEMLSPYLGFRHFFRHAYGVTLRWEKMEDKVRGIGAVRDAVSERIGRVRAFLDSLAAAQP